MSKYRVNQLVLTLALATYILAFAGAANLNPNLMTTGAYFVVCTLALHYLLNLVHIGSHNLLSRSRIINSRLGNLAAFFGGVTFADFRLTHLRHHRYLDDPVEDPDHFITNSGPWFTIPFKIFYHDVFFWRRGLYQSQGSWRPYLATRVGQILLVTLLFFGSLRGAWITYWLLPMLLLGLLNGLFLFYFPHYIPRLEQSWRAHPSLLNAPARLLIDISRVFHERHHDSVPSNLNYYPVLAAALYAAKHRHLRFALHHKYTHPA